ncbi:urease accessory protein D [Galendromus occidentalis]|uniref:Urease accessory protein D n=1 Tax=Galendromus occidentalis TaxID=34638 RepID=A0AAJ6VZ81_9ACAR|nr:urease accessory protein D [Galendromus occidentalis]
MTACNSSRQTRVCEAFVEFKSRAAGETAYEWSEPVKLFFTYPYKLFIPHPRVRKGEPTRWVYPVVFGGGLVSGDSLEFKIKCGTGSSILLTSQAFNKVYKSLRSGVCRQINDFTVERNSLLSVLPDLMVCFAESKYTQTQKIRLRDPTSSIVYLDWFSSGRIAYQERWQFAYLHTLLEIYLGEELVLRENLVLEKVDGLSISDRMKNFDVFGLLIIYGGTTLVKELKTSVLTELSKREEYGVAAESQNVFCTSLTKHEIGVVRFICADSRAAYSRIEKLLTPMFETYGGNPFFNKY